MNINYEVVRVDAERGSMEVRFFGDGLPGGVLYNIDLPLPIPAEEELHKLIVQFVPRHIFERQAQLAQGVDVSTVTALIGQTFVVPPPPPPSMPAGTVITLTPAPEPATTPVEVL